jgi:hypothetical protein
LGASNGTTNVEQSITDNNLSSLPDDNSSLAYAAVKKDTSKNITAMKTAANKAQTTASKSTKVKGVSTTKKNLVYKNVDLSNCKSAKDVVNTLKKNGVKGVTLSNIDDIKGLRIFWLILRKTEDYNPEFYYDCKAYTYQGTGCYNKAHTFKAPTTTTTPQTTTSSSSN